MEENKKELFDIDTSVMYILGISEALFDFQLLVQIKACFERKQYSGAIVTDMEMKEEKEDIYSVYDYFSPELSSENLIKANHYIKEIELNKEYDLFLVGMKEGSVSFGREIPEDLGLSVYGISRILHPDCVLLQVFWGDYQETDLHNMGKETEQIIGEEIDFFCIQNNTVDMYSSLNQHKIISSEIENTVVESTIDGLENSYIFSLNSEKEIERLTEAAIEKLQSYAEIERM